MANDFQVITQIQAFMILIISYRASHLTCSFLMVMMINDLEENRSVVQTDFCKNVQFLIMRSKEDLFLI